MKFKVGDRVRAVRNNYGNKGAIGVVVMASEKSGSPTYKVSFHCESEPIWVQQEHELEHALYTPTERRLIEALRPFARGSNWTADYSNALALLRELGEYPETCKECGQEIRHDTD